MLRVLVLLNDLSRTGAPKIALDILQGLRDKAEFRVIATSGGPLLERCEELAKTIILEDRSRCSRLQRWARKIVKPRRLRHFLNWKPDLIYINSVVTVEIGDRLELPNVPVLLHVHEMRSYLKESLLNHRQRLVNWPSRYIAASDAVAEELMSLCGIDRQRITTIHEFVPERYLERKPSVKRNERFTVGGSGFPTWRKGILLWLQTAAEVKRLAPSKDFRFRWVGMPNGDEAVGMHAMAYRLGVAENVEHVPPVPDPLNYFAEFDVFAMTSWEDPCPIVVLENMMLEKPVLCFSGGGGAPEEVGRSGLILEQFSPPSMAREIVRLMNDEAERNRLGKMARQRVLACFSESVQLPKIYREMIRCVDATATSEGRASTVSSEKPICSTT